MGDRQLQQYAAMHKNDPYILPMAIAESNARKQMRAQAQAKMAAQPQQKVADASIAEMAAPAQLPENQGIAQIPAPNIQNMAGGGIVAFADGGYADEDTMYSGEPVVRMAGGGVGYTEMLRAVLTELGESPQKYLNDPATKQTVDKLVQERLGAASPSSGPAAGQSAAPAASEEPRRLRKISEKVGGLGSTAVKTARKFTPAGLGIEAITSMGDYKTQAPDGIDTSLAGTASDIFRGEFGRARTGLVRGLGEAAADVGSFGANVLDYVVPGKAPVSTSYEKFLASNTNLQGPRARALANIPPAPSGGDIRGQVNRADAARFAAPGVDNASAAAGPSLGASPSAAPSSVLSSSTLANTSGGQGGQSSVLSGTALSGGKAGAGTASGTASVASNNPFSMESIQAAQKKAFGNTDYEVGALRNQLAELKSRTEQRAQEALDRRAKEVTEEGDVYKDRSDRLVERGKKLESQKDQNTGLALLNAGLAIMSTPGGLATAIGKGAQVGTAQYAAGLKDLRAAQERLDEANDRIEDLRMNRKDLNKRDIRALEKERDNALADGEKLTFAFAKDIYGLNRKQADDVFSQYLQGQKTVYEQSEQTKRTMATISASNDTRTKQIWAGLMQKHGNDPVAAAVEYNALEQGDKPLQAAEKLVQDRVGEWEKANKMQLNLMPTQAERDAALKSATQRIRNDIYTQMKLKSTIGAGGSSTAGFKFLGAESP
jgi:hypothetical protein